MKLRINVKPSQEFLDFLMNKLSFEDEVESEEYEGHDPLDATWWSDGVYDSLMWFIEDKGGLEITVTEVKE